MRLIGAPNLVGPPKQLTDSEIAEWFGDPAELPVNRIKTQQSLAAKVTDPDHVMHIDKYRIGLRLFAGKTP